METAVVGEHEVTDILVKAAPLAEENASVAGEQGVEESTIHGNKVRLQDNEREKVKGKFY